MRPKAAGHTASLERALELLRQLQSCRVHLPDDKTVTGCPPSLSDRGICSHP